MPIYFLYAAGCALIGGGLAVLNDAQSRSAAEAARRRQALEAELLRAEIDLEKLRAQAREAGLDPEKVIAGYEALRGGQISIDDVAQILKLAA